MFSKRVLTFLALLFTFGMFALASPVDTTGLVARDSSVTASEAAVVARGYGKDPGQALLDVLVKLKLDVDAKVALFDGYNTAPILELIAIINVAVQVIAKLNVAVAINVTILASILDIVVKILTSIIIGLAKYNIVLILTILLKVDVCLAAWIKAIIKVCPSFLSIFSKSFINVNLLLQLKLTLTLTALGLNNIGY